MSVCDLRIALRFPLPCSRDGDAIWRLEGGDGRGADWYPKLRYEP